MCCASLLETVTEKISRNSRRSARNATTTDGPLCGNQGTTRRHSRPWRRGNIAITGRHIFSAAFRKLQFLHPYFFSFLCFFLKQRQVYAPVVACLREFIFARSSLDDRHPPVLKRIWREFGPDVWQSKQSPERVHETAGVFEIRKRYLTGSIPSTKVFMVPTR